ncbi:MAG: Brp/Blh family beta-carotene 15,15'-dioxygenase [Bacteroidota bacterium]
MFRHIYLLFYAGVLLSLNLFNGGQIPLEWQVGIALSAILLVGIPHGAIDHIIYIRLRRVTQLEFYMPYLLLLFANVGLWLWQPGLGFALFVVLSAYHFGQSQFYYVIGAPKFSRAIIELCWGLSLLLALLVYRHQEVIQTYLQPTELREVADYLPLNYLTAGLLLCSAVSLTGLLYWYFTRQLNLNQLLSEVFVFALIHLSFYLLPALISFTLYFVLIHSVGTLREEVAFLKDLNNSIGWRGVFLRFLPLTAISLLGLTGLMLMSHYQLLPYSITFILFALIAGLTLPHTFVMTLFYSARGK